MSYRIPMVKLSMIRDGSVSSERRVMSTSSDAARLCRAVIGENDREEMIVLMVDAKRRVIAVHSVSVGSLSMSIVHPREVFKAAIVSNADAIILSHNHPSGDSTPSGDDRELTKRLVKGGKMIGIPVLDHVIIGEGETCCSFADNGWLN